MNSSSSVSLISRISHARKFYALSLCLKMWEAWLEFGCLSPGAMLCVPTNAMEKSAYLNRKLRHFLWHRFFFKWKAVDRPLPSLRRKARRMGRRHRLQVAFYAWVYFRTYRQKPRLTIITLMRIAKQHCLGKTKVMLSPMFKEWQTAAFGHIKTIVIRRRKYLVCFVCENRFEAHDVIDWNSCHYCSPCWKMITKNTDTSYAQTHAPVFHHLKGKRCN